MNKCNCDEWFQLMRYKPFIDKSEGFVEEEIHLDCRYRAVLVCENCHEEKEMVRQGKHFENDLNVLLEYVGELMHKLDPNEEKMLEE